MLAHRFSLACLCLLLSCSVARAQVAPPAPHEDEAFDLMNLMSDHGLHDLVRERWNAYGQLTYISSAKLPFRAPYTNAGGTPNSLRPDAEHSFTLSITLYFGLHLWPGAEIYFVPEAVGQTQLSNLKGLGGSIQNFELQKGGSATPMLYRARTFLRQTFDLGGEREERTSDPMQLAAITTKRRIVLTAGSFTILDVFDRNSVTWDPRQTFFNMAFMTHLAWDFPADARGYTFGGTAELYWDAWTLRVGRAAQPRYPNQLETEFRLWKFYGDQLEIEHNHKLFGLPGALRLLGFRNRVLSGRFDQAIAAFESDPEKNATTCTGFNYGSENANAPDLCWARKPNVKLGIGIALEQWVAPGIGVFLRAMFADGRTEVMAYNSADRSLSLGVVARGELWQRPLDIAGIGFASAWISGAHARYLALGGIDGFIGDGRLTQGAEMVLDVFYSLSFWRAFWLSADYQLISNPAYNSDRGPVHILSGRFHVEF